MPKLLVLIFFLLSVLQPAFLPKATPAADPQKETVVEETQQEEQCAVYIRSKTDGLNVRSGPSTSFPVLGKLDALDMVAYVDETENWYETVYKNERAYLSKRYAETVKMPTADEETEEVVNIGCRYLGTPYVYGATRLHDGHGHFLSGFSDKSFDCSSFMQYIFYYGKGVLLDVTTRTQVKQGETVPLDEIKRGDLLFFTNASRKDKTGIEKIGHVALYLGDDYILHTAGDHAVIEPLTAARRAYLLYARRV